MATARSFLLTVFCLAASAAHSEDPAAWLGKQRAAASPLQWEVRDASHPVLGNIRFAFLTKPVATPVRTATLASNVYFSCEKARRRVAIELTNATAPNDPTGLKPAVVPRLVCHRPVGGQVVREELNASWEFNSLGDALSRGLAPFPLRECSAITVQQEVLLPEDWGIRTAKIEFDITPYARELDAIFTACGELSAYAAPARAAAAKPAAPKPAGNGSAPWKPARTIHNGKTPVRAKAANAAPVVATLHPGDLVLVQPLPGDWWRVKPRKGTAYEGFVRRERITFK